MARLTITYGVGRLGVFSIRAIDLGEYFHFATRKQALMATIKVEKCKTLQETREKLIKLCGGDYYSPAEERGIHSSSSSQSISSHSG